MKTLDKPKVSPHLTAPRLEIILKCDSIGSAEAVGRSLSGIPGEQIAIIRTGIGAVNKSDVLVAETAGKLIIGFQVEPVPGLEKTLSEHRVEVRLYSVIYTLIDDLREISAQLSQELPQDQIIGSAKVIALFKSSRRGIILGCEITEGTLAVGQHFRVISAMGPVYSGVIDSLHSGDHAIQKAVAGQQVGLKLLNFDKVNKGDLIESFRPAQIKNIRKWQPSGTVIIK